MAWAGRPVMSSPAKRTRPDVGLHDAGDQVKQRGLAGAVGADDGADLARARRCMLDVVDGDEGAVALGQAVQLDQRAARRPLRLAPSACAHRFSHGAALPPSAARRA